MLRHAGCETFSMRKLGWIGAMAIATSAVLGAMLWPVPAAVDPEPLPDDLKMAAYVEAMEERWSWESDQMPDAAMPEVVFIEEVTGANWDSTLAECYRDAGFIVDGSVTRGWSLEPSPDLDSTDARIGMFRCDASYPWEGTLDSLLSRSELDALYSYYLNELTPCLALAGAPAPVAPPSRDEFVDQSGLFTTWSPYYFAASESIEGEEWERFERICPSRAPWQRDDGGFAPFA